VYPDGARVAIYCIDNKCFVRMHEDGRVFADTPMATDNMRDTHFTMRRKDSRVSFRSELWNKIMIEKSITIYRELFIIRRKKGATRCLYRADKEQLMIAPTSEFARLRVFRLKGSSTPQS